MMTRTKILLWRNREQEEQAVTFRSRCAAWGHSANIETCYMCFSDAQVRIFVFMQRVNIKFCVKPGKSATETLERFSKNLRKWSNEPEEVFRVAFLRSWGVLSCVQVDFFKGPAWEAVQKSSLLSLTQNLMFVLWSSSSCIVKSQMRTCTLSPKCVEHRRTCREHDVMWHTDSQTLLCVPAAGAWSHHAPFVRNRNSLRTFWPHRLQTHTHIYTQTHTHHSLTWKRQFQWNTVFETKPIHSCGIKMLLKL